LEFRLPSIEYFRGCRQQGKEPELEQSRW
jgi:hypothetical protein